MVIRISSQNFGFFVVKLITVTYRSQTFISNPRRYFMSVFVKSHIFRGKVFLWLSELFSPLRYNFESDLIKKYCLTFNSY